MDSKVLVVLTNWKRPQNLSLCIQAWREQSLSPASIVVIDQSPLVQCFPGADDVWKVGNNLGPLCRLWPALALAPRYDYILFADDDLLPGKQGLQASVEAAKLISNKFATLGQEGRTFRNSSTEEMGLPQTIWSYRFGNTPRLTDGLQVVDCTVRTHLVLAPYLHRLLRLREKLPADLCDAHDDLLLCLGLQTDPGWPSYVLPASTLERQLILENLPGVNGPEACWKRPDHLVQRSRFINLAHEAGWRQFPQG